MVISFAFIYNTEKQYFTTPPKDYPIDCRKRITDWLEDSVHNVNWLAKERDRINEGEHECHILAKGSVSSLRLALFYRTGFFNYHVPSGKCHWKEDE